MNLLELYACKDQSLYLVNQDEEVRIRGSERVIGSQ